MSDERRHHPSCSARFGGLCNNCPESSRNTSTREPDLTCPNCLETFAITGDTPIEKARALRDWVGCECGWLDKQYVIDITDTPAATGGDTPAAGATTSRVMSRWVSGCPGWIVRRRAVAW